MAPISFRSKSSFVKTGCWDILLSAVRNTFLDSFCYDLLGHSYRANHFGCNGDF
ncbi:hypothetical protein M405DRAFT_829755 [Rhizopogon salebrosus TDB-379]|nr:hypothetical protein M405DRAFT_829755 [Rhizopogon salebrosus TDB-379]